MPTPTFPALCAAMDAAGVEVRVVTAPDGLVLRLVDFHRLRSLDVPVRASFDRDVAVLCCSLALCAELPGLPGPGEAIARRWPELAALAGTSDLRVSDRAAGDRLS
ncbi:hypothetical protein NBH00_17930 [Paraconexibacter antarcticus]|uniref:Uncharacterized protein n=1 Tax=Paraconexibacter antarcticus TaxID=2949664 RepID=A0ABY5DMK6_9ACTN|nr:hypothetical protein [Paraconexibacter antarcticus]UTI63231.1 hypothetical protein NBH00_17930 [Paraconexibacter antarcticus]